MTRELILGLDSINGERSGQPLLSLLASLCQNVLLFACLVFGEAYGLTPPIYLLRTRTRKRIMVTKRLCCFETVSFQKPFSSFELREHQILNLPFSLNRTIQIAAPRLVRLRDRFLFSDRLQIGNIQWPVQCRNQNEETPPFFIVGNPRSGTTLLRAILSKHQDVFIPPENGTLGEMIRTFGRYRWSSWQTVVSLIFDEFQKGYEFHHWNIDLERLKRSAESMPLENRSLAGLMHLIYRSYGADHAPGKIRWGDKSVPGSSFHLWKVALVFPQAKYIHMVRDGRDCIASSVKAGFFGKNYRYAAYAWKDNLKECRKFGEKVKKENRFLEIRYEDLISSPKRQIDALCRFLELEPTETLLNYHNIPQNLPDVLSIPHHENVGKPLFRDSIGKWKQQIPESEVKSISRIIKDELAFYGYEEQSEPL